MKTNIARAALVAVVALGAGFGTSAAFAQAAYPAPSYQDEGYGGPDGFADQRTVPYDRFGQNSCGYNEVHTHIERRNCGGTHYSY